MLLTAITTVQLVAVAAAAIIYTKVILIITAVIIIITSIITIIIIIIIIISIIISIIIVTLTIMIIVIVMAIVIIIHYINPIPGGIMKLWLKIKNPNNGFYGIRNTEIAVGIRRIGPMISIQSVCHKPVYRRRVFQFLWLEMLFLLI